jgi:transposase-like protein
VNLEVLGNLGDFVGGFAVIVSLVYLALQIRQNSREVRNSTVQALLDRSTELFSETISSVIPDIQQKDAAGQPLTEADKIRLRLWHRRNFQFFEQVHMQFEQGRINDEIMQTYERRISTHFNDKRWPDIWASLRSVYTSSFREYVDELKHRMENKER